MICSMVNDVKDAANDESNADAYNISAFVTCRIKFKECVLNCSKYPDSKSDWMKNERRSSSEELVATW